MALLDPYNKDFQDLLRKSLHLSENASFTPDTMPDEKFPVQYDLAIDDSGLTYIIEIKRFITLDTLSSLNLQRSLWVGQGNDISRLRFVCVGIRATKEAKEAGELLGITVITVPWEMPVFDTPKEGAQAVKPTSPKAWRIIAELLRLKETSIRQLSLNAGVSYGWAHATIKTLESKGIVSNTGGYVTISDVPKLLNGIAWERVFQRLGPFLPVTIPKEDPLAAARGITDLCAERSIPIAFTSFTAGELYTGYATRHDAIYLYVPRDNRKPLSDIISTNDKDGLQVFFYLPDRDVFNDSRIINGIRVVSPAQLLLDLAGLGYSGKDIAMKMVEKYATL